jgi:hypothetical protein
MSQIEDKLDFIEKELSEIKLIIIQKSTVKQKVSMKGLLKGMKFGEPDIEKSKKSLFKTGA